MAEVKPFFCIRPDGAVVSQVAALPYDVYSRKEACQAVKGHPLSFLNIDRAETQFGEEVDTYDEQVYEKARQLLDRRIQDGTFLVEKEACYYLYQLTMEGRSQTGIVACSSIEDYENGVIKKHENTREEKELDRIRHVEVTNAHTGPIFLAYRGHSGLEAIMKSVQTERPLYDFVSEDGIGHRVWRIGDAARVQAIEQAFKEVDATYIADGHHRAASAVKVGLRRREAQRAMGRKTTGDEPYEYFLSVLFPEEQLMIMPYNRVVKDLNGLTMEKFFTAIHESFDVAKIGKEAYAPKRKGTFGMYIQGEWYLLKIKDHLLSQDPVKGLDVSLLQDHLLGPILGIGDPRVDQRIDFIGGIRGLGELERRVREDMKAAFSMYPTTIQELFAVADAGMLMPPKSTWFEPKLRSGIFIHGLGAEESPIRQG